MGNVLIQAKRNTDRTIIEELRCSDSGHLITSDLLSESINSGDAYAVFSEFLAVADAAEAIVVLTTGDQAEALYLSASMIGDGNVELYEDTVFTGGASVTPLSLNRAVIIAAETTAVTDPTVSVDGTLLAEVALLGGEKNQANFASVQAEPAIIMAPSTVYMVRVTNNSGSASDVNIDLKFIEFDQ